MTVIYRTGKKDAWVYVDKNGMRVVDKKILDYIAALPPIPPAYRDVEIFVERAPKILFQGKDAAGRLQQIYSPKWRKAADAKKFKTLIEFGKRLPEMAARMEKVLTSPRSPLKERHIAVILRITVLCGFRIGQMKYQKLYSSTGLSTLQKKHLKFGPKTLEIRFVGKKGMMNECFVTDPIVINELRSLTQHRAADDFLFTYHEKGELRIINGVDVNNWLKKFNPEFTTKAFRTFDVNDRLIDGLKDTNPAAMTAAQRKKKVVELIKAVSCQINNTPAICKKSYIFPDLLELYIEHPRKYAKMLINDKASRVNFIRLLESIY